MPILKLNYTEREKLRDLYFQLESSAEKKPDAKQEAMIAIRCLKAVHSNAIEDKSIDRVFLQILLHNAGISDKSKISQAYNKAHLEIQGQQKMLIELENAANQYEPLSLSLVHRMHQTLFQESWPEIAGRFRTTSVEIAGMRHLPPHHSKISEQLHQYLQTIMDDITKIEKAAPENFFEILHLSARLHYLIAAIHPFEDGNGRVARAAGDFVRLRFGMFFDVIMTDYRDYYLDALAECEMTDVSPLADFLQFSYLETLTRISTFFNLA